MLHTIHDRPSLYNESSFADSFLALTQLLEEEYEKVVPECLKDNIRFKHVMGGRTTSPVPTQTQLKTFFECIAQLSRTAGAFETRKTQKRKREILAYDQRKKNMPGDTSGTDSESISFSDPEMILCEGELNEFEEDIILPSPSDSKCMLWKGSSRKIREKTFPIFYMQKQRHSVRKLVYGWFVGNVDGYVAMKTPVQNTGDFKVPRSSAARSQYAVHSTCSSETCVNPAHLVLLKRGTSTRNIDVRPPFSWDMFPGCDSPWNTPPASPRM